MSNKKYPGFFENYDYDDHDFYNYSQYIKETEERKQKELESEYNNMLTADKIVQKARATLEQLKTNSKKTKIAQKSEQSQNPCKGQALDIPETTWKEYVAVQKKFPSKEKEVLNDSEISENSTLTGFVGIPGNTAIGTNVEVINLNSNSTANMPIYGGDNLAGNSGINPLEYSKPTYQFYKPSDASPIPESAKKSVNIYEEQISPDYNYGIDPYGFPTPEKKEFNKDEELIINIEELADELAEEAMKIESNTKTYQVLLEYYKKLILKHERQRKE